MPTDTQWYVEGRVIYTRVTGDITMEDVIAMNARTVELLKQGTPLIHHIVNVEQMTSFPLKLAELTKAVQFVPEMGWLLIVGTIHPIIRFFGSIITQVSKARFRTFEKEPDALHFLWDVDVTLDKALIGGQFQTQTETQAESETPTEPQAESEAQPETQAAPPSESAPPSETQSESHQMPGTSL